MQCAYLDADLCRSCTLLDRAYPAQLAGKQRHAQQVLAGHVTEWLPPVASRESGFRNKAKMVVTGTVEHPRLGILDARGQGVDLRHCGLYTDGLRASFPPIAEFITRAGLVPYDVPGRRGELKYVLVTESPGGELMLRFVLRTEDRVARIRTHLPTLLVALPNLVVVSANIHPEHKAVLEGEREILLTERSTLTMHLGGIDLHLRPQSFFQTNTEIAAALYQQGREWVEDAAPASVWDLYSGVGGFALHCAAPGRDVIGVETSAEAVASAQASATQAGLDARFRADDATAFALGAEHAPELVIVNPPRRGLGPELGAWLERSGVRRVVYSSCNVTSLERDLAVMPSLAARRGRLFDMFPHTRHAEVMVLLERH
ncbi:MAG: 23S rRNA (uracil(747)-C(5))-methyltransferase RlmC [Georgenia sp.]